MSVGYWVHHSVISRTALLSERPRSLRCLAKSIRFDISVAKERQIFSVEFCQLLKLDEIHSALAEFTFRNKGPCFAKPVCDLDLG